MKYVISNYNNDLSWVREYTNDYVVYDQSGTAGLPETIIRLHIGSDIYDKFSFIIDNYHNLPDIVVFVKGNLFKYISKEEFDGVCQKKTFTPLLTKNHKTTLPVCFYSEDGMYNEINNFWYLNHHRTERAGELIELLGIRDEEYLKFAPGSNYIVPRENILKHSKEYYKKLRSFLEWGEYPGEAQIIERHLYTLWS